MTSRTLKKQTAAANPSKATEVPGPKDSTPTPAEATASNVNALHSGLRHAAELAARIVGGDAAADAVREFGSRLAEADVDELDTTLDEVEVDHRERVERWRSQLVTVLVELNRRLHSLSCAREISADESYDLAEMIRMLEVHGVPGEYEVEGKRIPGESSAETVVRLLRDDLAVTRSLSIVAKGR